MKIPIKTSYILVFFLFCSLAANVVLIKGTTTFYKRNKLALVFPHNLNRFKDVNQSLSKEADKELAIFFGDSRVAQWDLEQITSNHYAFLNRGIGGETTAQLKLRLQQDVISLDPQVVVIQAGINDLVAISLAPERGEKIQAQCLENMKDIIDTLLENDIQVVLTTIIPPAQPSFLRRLVWSNTIDVAVSKFNDYWLTRAPREGLTIIDVEKALKNEDGSWKKNVNQDTLHLTQTAYIYLNQSLEQLIN